MRTLVRRVVGAMVVTVMVTACAPTSGADGPAPSTPPGGAVIVARALAFDRSRLEIPAAVGFALVLDNREAAPHNVSIVDPRDGHVLFAGEIFGGPGTRTYAVPPITAGSYTFRCDVHPEMRGTVVAGQPG